jgi:nicotinamide mononucleotide transporter
MTSPLEVTANVFNAGSIVLAGRNSIHTWWTGIVGCALFAVLFFRTQLYADALLQLFFVGSSAVGWVRWHTRRDARGAAPAVRPIQRTPPALFAAALAGALAVAAVHAWLLRRFTDAFAPWPDALVLTLSLLGQLLLVGRRIETWWCWLAVNTIAIPLYFARGLTVTALLYVAFLVNAFISLRHWRAKLGT